MPTKLEMIAAIREAIESGDKVGGKKISGKRLYPKGNGGAVGRLLNNGIGTDNMIAEIYASLQRLRSGATEQTTAQTLAVTEQTIAQTKAGIEQTNEQTAITEQRLAAILSDNSRLQRENSVLKQRLASLEIRLAAANLAVNKGTVEQTSEQTTEQTADVIEQTLPVAEQTAEQTCLGFRLVQKKLSSKGQSYWKYYAVRGPWIVYIGETTETAAAKIKAWVTARPDVAKKIEGRL